MGPSASIRRMHALRRHQRPTAWFALALWVLVACLPTGSQAWAPSGAAGWAQVCTVTGMVWVRALAASPDPSVAAPDPAPADAAGMDAAVCGWCQWHASLGLGIPSAPRFVDWPARTTDRPERAYRNAKTAVFWHGARPRAPPFNA